MIDENVNINIFNDWALQNKDQGMEKGHAKSVSEMLKIVNEYIGSLDHNFKFLDLGCGNGWVVKMFSNNNLCDLSVGVDGSENMIKKAKLKDSKGIYYQSNIEEWNFKKKFDIIFSMETFYYFNNINNVLNNINSKLLTNGGLLIIGIDHYKENKPSLSWENEIGIQTQTLSIKQWVNKLKESNFQNVQFKQVGKKSPWMGTLILYANKNR